MLHVCARGKIYGRGTAIEGTDELALLEVRHSGGQVFAREGGEDGRLCAGGNLRAYLLPLLAVEGQVVFRHHLRDSQQRSSRLQ